MTTTATPHPVDDLIPVPLHDVEAELARQLQEEQDPGGPPILRARMSNLVIYSDRPDQTDRIAAEIPEIVAIHPARVVLLIADPEPGDGEVKAAARVRSRYVGQHQEVGSEQITLRAGERAAGHLPYVVRKLLIGDLPTNLWWTSLKPPPLAGNLLFDLAENAEQILYDSIGWPDPTRGVAAVSSWLAKFERGLGHGRWRVASDLNWRRLKPWRRFLGQGLDPASAPGAMETVTEILVEHGPHAMTQGWSLVSWLASRLGWKVKATRLQPNVELAWQFLAPSGPLRVRIRRLAEGPSEVHRVRVACSIGGKLGALDFVAESDRRLAVRPEGIDAQPRTMTVPPHSLAELVGHQLSDRERDTVFTESMAVAQILAQSVLT